VYFVIDEVRKLLDTPSYHTDNSTAAKHSIKSDHSIQFQDSNVLDNKPGLTEYSIKKTTEIELYIDNMDKEERVSLSRS
jgi:hypothetical protein